MKFIQTFSFIFLILFNWQSSAQFPNMSHSTVRTSNNSGTELLLQSTDYLYIDSVWKEDSRITYNYLSNSLLVDSVLYEHYFSGSWEYETLIKYLYQASFQPYQDLELNWNGYNWENHIKRSYTYNTLFQLETILIQTYNNGNWYNNDSTAFSYNSYDSLDYYYSYRWDTQNWVNGIWSIYSYNVGGNLEERIIKSWSEFYNQWINTFKYTFSYYNDYQLADKIYERWIDSIWVKQTKTEFIYDTLGYGYLTESYLYNWDGNDWIESKKYIYNYDEYFHLLQELIELNRVGNEWEYYKKTVYERIIVNVEKEPALIRQFKLLQNYPNPFNPNTKISWQSPVGSHQTLKIYDALGKEVAILVDEEKSAGEYEIEFNASGLPSGIYFYQLKAGSFVDTGKMVLIK